MAVKDVVGALDEIREAIKENGSELPAVTSSDNGKLLKVVNGKWNKGDAPSELPAVTGADDGDVLTVVEGQWAKAAPSGGGANILFVGKTIENDVITLDKTWQEIHDADLAFVISTEGDDKTIEIVTRICAADGQGNPYSVTAADIEYVSESADGYPANGN